MLLVFGYGAFLFAVFVCCLLCAVLAVALLAVYLLDLLLFRCPLSTESRAKTFSGATGDSTSTVHWLR
jgi:hypothetical protein